MDKHNFKDSYTYHKLVEDAEDPYSKGGKGHGHGDGGQGGKGFVFVPPVPWHVVRIPFRHFITFFIGLLVGAFFYCIFWAMLTDFDKATTVICTVDHNRPVRNYLPSMSAAMGDFHPSKEIWEFTVVFHTPARFIFASLYVRYLKKALVSQKVALGLFACGLHVAEVLGLMGLTVISSKQNLPLHAFCFGTFITCSLIYQVILVRLLSNHRQIELNKLQTRALVVKKIFFKVSIICSILLFVVYFRHTSYCEEGVYTIFALLEYIVVMANVIFNATAYWDFYDHILVFDIFQPCKLPAHRYSWDY